MSNTVHYAHEVAPQTAARLDAVGAKRRPLPTLRLDPGLPEATKRKVLEDQHRRGAAMLRNRVLVCGRVAKGRVVWDVLKIEGPRVSLYAAGCAWQGEAFELAKACLTGRIATSLGGVRSLLIASSGLPDTTLASTTAKPDVVLPNGDAEFWQP